MEGAEMDAWTNKALVEAGIPVNVAERDRNQDKAFDLGNHWAQEYRKAWKNGKIGDEIITAIDIAPPGTWGITDEAIKIAQVFARAWIGEMRKTIQVNNDKRSAERRVE